MLEKLLNRVPPNSRMTPQRKERLITALKHKHITKEQLEEFWGIPSHELETWTKLLAEHGPRALRVSRRHPLSLNEVLDKIKTKNARRKQCA